MARAVTDYLGKVPKANGTGPKNLPKTASAALSQVRARSAGVRRPASPSVSTSRASAGYGSPPGGAGGGIPKATSPMASRPQNVTGPKSRMAGSMGRPRADFPPQI